MQSASSCVLEYTYTDAHRSPCHSHYRNSYAPPKVPRIGRVWHFLIPPSPNHAKPERGSVD